MKNFGKMKQNIKILAITTLLIGSLESCTQSTVQVLADPEHREEVMQLIANDSAMATEMINTMMNTEESRQMMEANQEMTTTMMGDQQMMAEMMENDPELRSTMMHSMMNNGQMMGHMMQMMNQRGMMSDECLESSMGMMNESGMMMNDDRMHGDGSHMDQN